MLASVCQACLASALMFPLKHRIVASSVGPGALHCHCGGECPFLSGACTSLLGEHQMEKKKKGLEKEQSINHSLTAVL